MRNTQRIPSPTRPSNWLAKRRTLASAVLFSATALLCAGSSAISASAQTALSLSSPNLSTIAQHDDHASLDLPDAPGESIADGSAVSSSISDSEAPSAQNSAPSPATQASSLPEAARSQRYPRPGQPAPILTAGDKVRMGFTGAFSIFSITGWVTSAGYSQLTNGTPNWGTDRGAFGQRLWCSAALATSENLFSDSLFAPLLHEDPRYYRLGRTHKFLPRLAYAATRSIITRSDSGSTVPNFSQIFGNAAGSALTNAYYPQANRNATDTMSLFGSSIGGTALGDVIAEFFGRVLFHHDKD